MQPPRTPWGGHSAPANPLGSGAVNPIPAHPRAYGTAVIALPAPGQPTEGCSFESAIRKRGRPRGSKNNQTCRPVRVVSWEELQQIGEGGRDPLVLALAAPQKPAPLEARQSMAPLSSPESLFDPVSGEQSEGQAGPERTSEGLLGESQEFEQGREDGKGLGNDPEVLPGKSPVSEPGQEGGGEAAGEVGRPNGVESGPNRAEDGTYLAASLIELSADRRPDGPEGQEGEGGVAYKFGRPKSAESGPDRTEEDIHLPVTSPAGNSPNGLGWFYSLLGPSHQSPRLQIEDGRRIAPAASPEEPPETEMEKKAEPERSTARRCSACHVSKSERWRRGPEGPRSLCNRCGVYWVQKRDQWGELLEHFSTPPGGANGSPRVDEGTARLTVPAAVPEVRPQSAGLAHGDELAQAGNSAGPNAREDPISAEGLAGPTSPDGLVLAANRTVGRATFREVRSEEEAAAALKKSLWAAATWQRMAHSVARTTSLRSRLEEFGRGGEEGGVSGGGNGSVLAASAEEECNTPVGATRLGKSGESKEKAPAGGAECQRTGGGAAGREQRGDGNAGVPLAGGAECLGNGGGAATQTGEGGAAVQLAGAGRRYGPEEVWCGKYRGRWGPDGTFVWSDSKSESLSSPSLFF